MKNCLVTTLKGVVNNDKLQKLGFINTKFVPNATFNFNKTTGNLVKARIISGQGNFYVSGVSVGTTVDTTASTVSLGDINSGVTVVEFDLYKNIAIKGAIVLDDMQYSPVVETITCDQGNTTVDGQAVHINSTGNIESLKEKLPNLTTFSCTYHSSSYVTGDITRAFSDCLKIVYITVNSSAGISGSLEEFAATQVSKGRNSGLSIVKCNGKITQNGTAVTNNTNKNIYYGSGMSASGVNPTAEETEQGWCIR